jgi:photosystem II stability/assembly factor-like uncharacterized protein
MKFESFLSLFGERWRTRSARRARRAARRRPAIGVEQLETRDLLNAGPSAPKIIAANPPDRFTSTNTRPVISVTYSEPMGQGVADPANYFLFNSQGNPVSIQSVSYDPAARTATLDYNNGLPLPASDYTLFVAGDKIFDLLDGINDAGQTAPLPICPPGELIAANAGTPQGSTNGQNVSTISMPGNARLGAGSNYSNPNLPAGLTNPVPSAAKMADVNRDGIGDLVVVNRLANDVEIYFGLNGPDGGLSQAPNVVLAANGQPAGLTLQDINGDGIPDILVVNQAGNGSVTVFRSAGPGTYAAGQNFVTSVGGINQIPVAVVASDFNGDGNIDLAVANSVADANGRNLSILAGNASGNFGLPVAFATGIVGQTDIKLINYNRNDQYGIPLDALGPHPDVVVSGLNGLQIMRNETRFPTTNNPTPGALTFATGPNLPGVNVTGIDVGDLNKDSDPDIVALSDNPNAQVTSYINNGPAFGFSFTALAPVRANQPGFASTDHGITLTNVNNDDFLDVVVANDNFTQPDTISVLLGTLGGTFLPPPAIMPGTPLPNIVDFGPVDVGVFPYVRPTNAVGNLNLNRLPQITEAATANSVGNDATVLQSLGNGNFVTSVETSVPNMDDVRATASGDLNGDGLPDLVTVVAAGTSLSNTVLVQLADPNPPAGVTRGTTFLPPVPITVGNFPVAVAIASLTVTRDAMGNITGPGPLDIIVANQSDDSVTILGNDGAGNFPLALQRTVKVGRRPTGIAVADFNGDGIPDLAVSHDFPINIPPTVPQDRGVSVLFGDGNRGFGGLKEVIPNVQAAAVVAADFNNDGKQDLAVLEDTSVGRVGTLYYLRGDGKGSFTLFGSFNANEDPSSVNVPFDAQIPVGIMAVGDLNRDGFPDIVVGNKGLTNGPTGNSTIYISVLLNNRGIDFSDPIRKDILTNTSDRLTSLAVVNINHDLFPDIVGSFRGSAFGQTVNNVFGLLGSLGGALGDPRFYVTMGSGRVQVPTVLTVGSDPFIRVTSFGTRGSAVSNNLIVNGNFEAAELTRETGTLDGWQQASEPDSHGYFAIQNGFNSPLSASPVTQPSGLFRATLDQQDVNLRRNSVLGVQASTLNPDRARSVDDYSGAHVLYQDFFIPATASSVTITFQLYIRNTDPDSLGNDLNRLGYSDPTLVPQLDFFPNVPNAPANQQVRVDLIDPNAIDDPNDPLNITKNLFSVRGGPDGPILKQLFATTQNRALIFDQGSTTPRSVQLGRVFPNPSVNAADNVDPITITLTPAELTAFRGKKIRLRFAEVNNQGKLIVGVDNVQVAAAYLDTQPPSLSGLRMRNPGIGANPESFGGNTTDTTVVGKVADEGTASNIDTITFTAVDKTTGLTVGTFPFGRFDALGNFEFKLPLTLPGPYTILVQGTDLAGNSFTTSFDFTFQGPSLDTWQAQGPGPIRFVSPLVRYSTLSGNVTAIAADPRDVNGLTLYLGSDNGGIWKTTDGGHNWTPLTRFQTDQNGQPVPVPIGSIVLDPLNPDIVFAATGIADNQPTSHPGRGILRSTDGGKTFQLVGQIVNSQGAVVGSFDGSKISKIAIREVLPAVPGDPPAHTVIYVAVASGPNNLQGVYRSTDGGLTYVSVLDPAKMFLETGNTPLGAGASLPSVTDLVIDPNSRYQQNIWIGLGNIALAPDSPNTSVWFSPNGGDTWFRRAGGQQQTSQGVFIPNQIIPTGVGVRRVTLAIAQRPSDESDIYALINNPTAAPETPLASGLYKTRSNGLGWTHVMLRQIKPIPGRLHNYVDLDLFGNVLAGNSDAERFREQDAVGALLVDPSDPNVVYIGGSTRYFFNPFLPSQNPHGLIRVDTSNMRDTEYVSPFVARPTPGNIPNFAPPVIPFDIPNDGDDIFKAGDAAENQTNLFEPGRYLGGEAYQGEGVFWFDMQLNESGGPIPTYNQLRLPATINTLTFDANGRMVVGTAGGIWRATTTGYIYDVTSGGAPSIESEAGENLPREPSVNFTDLNGNLQIGDQVSVAADPINRGAYDAAFANLGFAQTTGGLPNSLQWVTTIDQDASFDPFVELAPFAGPVRAGPAPLVLPSIGAPFTTIYRTLANRGIANAAGLTFRPDRQVQRSDESGTVGTFQSIVNGLDLSTALPAFFPPLAINQQPSVNAAGLAQDELLFGTNKVYRSTNSGQTWDQISPILTQGTITALAIAKSGRQAYYVGTDRGEVFVDLRNGSTPFALRNTGLPALQINGITVDPSNENIAYVAFDGFLTGRGRIFRTIDGGMTWQDISGTGAGRLPDQPAYAIAVDPRPQPGAPSGKLYAGTETGVFVSADGGTTWQQFGQGIPNVPARDVSFDPGTETVAVATFGAGTFTISTDHTGPQVVAINPSTPTSPGLTTVQVIFNEPVDPRSFTPGTVRSFQGPNGPIAILSVTPAPNPLTAQVDNTFFDVSFLPQATDGVYTLTLAPTVHDFVGNLLDQNANGIQGEDQADQFQGRFVIDTSDNGRFVTGVYHDELNRPADTTGFINFTGALNAGRANALLPVATGIVTSDEARGNLVAGFYSLTQGLGTRSELPIGDLLKRAPSDAEIANWVASLKAGATPQQVIQAIAASIEYFNRAGQNNATFIGQLYQDLLARDSDAASAPARSAAVGLLVTSAEYRNDLVTGYFQKLLGRAPSPAELSFFTARQQATSDEEVQAEIIGSSEYFARAGGTNDGFINQAFMDILGRPPTGPEVTQAQAQLAAGASRQDVVAPLFKSNEYAVNLVNGLYQKYLGRPADQSGLDRFVPAFLNGLSQEGLVQILVGSDEYYTNHAGGATTKLQADTNWANAAFLDILGRAPSVLENQGLVAAINPALSGWLNLLAQKEAAVRFGIAGNVVTSPEYRINLVNGYFTRLLGRPAATDERNLYIGFLQQGATDEQVQAAIIGSPEYFANAGGTNLDWLNKAFQDILGRSLDPQGQSTFLPQLNAGTSREVVALAILNSDEYRRNLVTFGFNKFLHRAPDATAFNTFVPALANGLSQEGLFQILVGSVEYYNLQIGTATAKTDQDANWVRAVYTDLLGRNASPSEVNVFVGALAQAEVGIRGQIVQGFTDSTEFLNRIIAVVYTKYLGRAPSTGELNIWLPLLRQPSAGPGQPSPVESFIAQVVSSLEYLQNQRDASGNFGNAAWVESLYNNVLGRPSDQPGAAAAVNAVLQGYFRQRLDFANAITTSTEFRNNLVANYYLTFLRRKASPAEVANQVSRFDTGARDEQVIATIVASPEYFQNPSLGNNTNSIWLNKVYNDLLGRDRDAGSEVFLTLLNNATPANAAAVRLQVVTQILDSDEFYNRQINLTYVALLGRQAAVAEQNIWRNRIRREGLTLEQVTSNILASPEYFQRAHPYP